MNSKEIKTKRLSYIKVIISLVMTIFLWAVVTNAWGYTNFFFNTQSGSLINQIYDILSRLIWLFPSIILLFRYKSDLSLTFGSLFKNKSHMKSLSIAIAGIVLYHISAMFLYHGGFWINPEVNFLSLFIKLAMVAFSEELVYRGWGQNALSEFMSERKANIISNIFFVLLHLPAYLIKFFLTGSFPIAAIATQCVMVFVLGLLFGFLFNKGKSLWSPIIFHFLSDFLSIMLIG